VFSETRYALNGDLRVAYRASREGARDIVSQFGKKARLPGSVVYVTTLRKTLSKSERARNLQIGCQLVCLDDVVAVTLEQREEFGSLGVADAILG
jgi:hypothetical protein